MADRNITGTLSLEDIQEIQRVFELRSSTFYTR